MKEYEASNIRNLTLIGHGSAGKTILAESMLACGGAIHPNRKRRARKHGFGLS